MCSHLCVTGATMLLSAHSDDSDMLWLISSDNFPFRSLISESHVCNILCHMYVIYYSASAPTTVYWKIVLIFSSLLCDHINPLLSRLHWLKASEWITYKVAVLAYKCQYGLAPTYLRGEL